MVSQTSTAIIVLNWNKAQLTIECVDSLISQTAGPFKIFLVDNNSSSDQKQLLVDEYKNSQQVELIFNEKNVGFGKAHNQLVSKLEEKRFKWLAFLNNDAVATPNWLKNMLTCAKEEKCDLVSSKMLQYEHRDRIDNVGHFMLNTGEVIPLGHGQSQAIFNQRTMNVGPCAGACLIKTEVFKSLGGFDEHFFVGYEDAEFGVRAWLCGYDCVFEPTATVFHRMSSTIGSQPSSDYLSTIQASIFYTWFKLMPTSIIAFNATSFIIKYASVYLIDILLLRFKYIRVMSIGISRALKNWPETWRTRQHRKRRLYYKRGFWEIQNQLTFFLPFDVKRLYNLIILNQRSKLEGK